ncbi:MAG: prepilin-type N-terminal cleavage/methylation domain-containing protein [Planctomycetota bacterium]
MIKQLRLHRRGLTLIELVVVLVILSALTGIAVQSLEPLADQARHESTQRTLEEIDNAFLIRTLTTGNNIGYSGYVADMGQLPVQDAMADPEDQLAALYAIGTQPAFDIDDFDDTDFDPVVEVPVAAGWRGPYISLPNAQNGLLDGYGRTFALTVDAGTLEVRNLTSLGANGTASNVDTGYNVDQSFPGGAWVETRYEGAFNVVVQDSEGLNPDLTTGETIRARVYGPTAGAASLLQEQATAEAAVDGRVAFSELFNDISCGPRAVVAYITTGTVGDYAVVEQTAPQQIMVVPGLGPTITLVLR